MIFENFTLDLTRPISQILFAILFCRFPKQLLRVRLPRHLPRGRVRRPQLHEARHQVQEDLRRLRRVHRSHSPSRRGANQWVKRKKLTFFTLSYSVFLCDITKYVLNFLRECLALDCNTWCCCSSFFSCFSFCYCRCWQLHIILSVPLKSPTTTMDSPYYKVAYFLPFPLYVASHYNLSAMVRSLSLAEEKLRSCHPILPLFYPKRNRCHCCFCA